ncbi:DegT/DnrJ/EryC1/StrS family aminotransferase [Streptomyces sp. N2-109]|uniref:DegT/DnrJ/EryC1/StrS family aminotransferase n=1 Tax=Streptomyces gossypii TaxID=2883101 RepID=A0ABT2JRN5_9ACTN|nr:DegT/DnrJ/EryC1/StrS family aminotransferase [Streptomyces gossypii]MCT2590552.1 DegT/DnrJ/EryC1/StrS family aminotransferase [Streptomyces gossypii]
MATTQLRDAGIGAGDEVVVPAYGGGEVAEAVRAVGGRPVIADIDPRSFCLDPAAAAAAVTDRTAALAPVHLFGHTADTVRLGELAERFGVRTVEFGAPAVGQTLETARRRRYAAYLGSRLTGVIVPSVAEGAAHTYSEYVVRVPGNGRPDRDAFKHALRAKGVRCWVPVKIPVHWMPDFRAGVRLPEAERAADECLALPIDASMTQRELQRMASACNALGGLLLEPAC